MNLVLKVGIALFVGFLGGKIAIKLKLPNVSGYVLIGLLLGPSLALIFRNYGGFITSSDHSALNFISELALSFIAFSIGTEFTSKSLKSLGKTVFIMATMEVLFAVLFVFVTIYFLLSGNLGFDQNERLAFALIMSSLAAATAPAATLIVMRQYNAYGPVSKSIIGITALDDIYGIIVFSIFLTIAKVLTGRIDENTHIAFSIIQPLLEIIASIGLGAVVGFLLILLSNKFYKTRDDLQILILASICIVYGLAVYLSSLLKITLSPLLTNIVLGIIIANFKKNPTRMFDSLNDFVAPFYVLFFTFAGASLDIRILAKVGILGIGFVLARGVGKVFGAFVGGKISRAKNEVTKYTGFGLLPQGGITIGLLVIIYKELNDFYSIATTIAMVSVLIYETTGPIFAKYAITKAGEIHGGKV